MLHQQPTSVQKRLLPKSGKFLEKVALNISGKGPEWGI
jgi:hypothetical protein